MIQEIAFLFALWKANLLSAMEYRFSFILQILGMMLNNSAYFIFWIIFFDVFESVRGWGLVDMFVLFGIVASSYGLGVLLFGNIRYLADIIAEGRMDYYLSLPRPVLLHSLASHSFPSGMGDFLYGILSFVIAGQYAVDAVLRFALGVIFGTVVFVAFHILVQSLAFWMGNASMIAMQASNALVTFALYPMSLFDGTAKLFLFTVLPAAFIGTVPAEFVFTFSWERLLWMSLAAGLLMGLAVIFFYRGLRRYESGSAIQVQV